VELANDLSLASEQVKGLSLKVETVLQRDLKLGNLGKSNLFESLLFGSIIKVVLLEEDASECLLSISSLGCSNELGELNEQVLSLSGSELGDLGLGSSASFVGRALKVLQNL